MKSLLAVLFVLPAAAFAQTPQQMEYERQQREYRLQMERQQQEQQRQQQIMQENARRQQEEMNRLNRLAPGNPVYSPPASTPTPNSGSQNQRPQSSGSGGDSASTQPTGPAPKAPAVPSSWTKVPNVSTVDIYADLSSIKRGTENTRLMADIRNYKTYQVKLGKAYLSSREVWAHDCDNQRSKPLGWTYYSQHNAQGAVIDRSSPDQLSGSWYEPREFGGLIGQLVKVACR